MCVCIYIYTHAKHAHTQQLHTGDLARHLLAPDPLRLRGPEEHKRRDVDDDADDERLTLCVTRRPDASDPAAIPFCSKEHAIHTSYCSCHRWGPARNQRLRPSISPGPERAGHALLPLHPAGRPAPPDPRGPDGLRPPGPLQEVWEKTRRSPTSTHCHTALQIPMGGGLPGLAPVREPYFQDSRTW